ncbi:ABC transporter permease [Mechercharimyces sp. CAU 1602]|uniref:ABC transporter permease n=1 Tax=Mechercharimyces sp. CAU 1602 TaxID=2973933 RepID=UPI002162D83B|nr:ABC transporter permease [Mechercharimyces sp. CAU 1602]MCS1352008.1 ABC transporter permease [Mechercharimyces sp. CAU 1602]
MFRELIKYKELIYFLVHKEIRIRYRNSFFGFFWTLLEPLGLMMIYALVFSVIGRGWAEPFEGKYPLFILAGMMPWMFFNNTLKRGMTSLSRNGSLLKKIYFPRQIFPLTDVLANMVNFVPALLLVIVAALIFNPSEIQWLHFLYLPGLILLQSILAFSFALLLGAINVYYRDVEFIINLVLRGWMYLTPIIYPVKYLMDKVDEVNLPFGMTTEVFVFLYNLNPMVPIINLYQQLFFSGDVTGAVDRYGIIYCILFVTVLFVVAWVSFKRLNRRVGEVI